jgi:WD40 repeat protein
VRPLARTDVDTLTISHDGHDLAIVDLDGFCWLCDVERALPYQRIDLLRHRASLANIDAILLSPDGKTLAADTGGNHMLFWDVRTGRPVQDRPGFTGDVEALAWSRDGRGVVAVSGQEVCRWDATTGRRLARVEVQPLEDAESLRLSKRMTHPVLSPGGDRMVRARGRHLQIMDCRTGRAEVLSNHAADIDALAFSLDGKLLASMDEVGILRLLDVEKGRWLRTIKASETVGILRGTVRGMAFSADGGVLALGESRSRVHLFDVRTGKLRTSLHGTLEKEAPGAPPPGAWAGAFSQDGRLLYTGYRNHFRAWDLGLRRDVFAEKSTAVYPHGAVGRGHVALALSADQRFLVRVSASREMSLVETASGQAVHRFSPWCTAAAFAPAGWRLAGASCDDFSVLIWDLGALFRSLPAGRPGTQGPPRLWEDMADRDAGVAQRALWRLAATPGMESYLAGQLVPRVPGQFREWLRDLNSDEFTTREKAEKDLGNAGEAAVPALEAALAGAVDLELRRRLERLLRPLERDGLLALRRHRTLLALEARGTGEARRLLRRLAAGEALARLTQEARAALRRLEAPATPASELTPSSQFPAPSLPPARR